MGRKRPRAEQTKGADAPSWVHYCLDRKALVPGNGVDLLVDASAAYPAMLAAIDAAKSHVLLESYIFRDDQAGQQFAAALVKKAQAGITVCLIVDGFGTLPVPREFFSTMTAAGVHVLTYRSPAPWARNFGLFHRDHRKLLVIDNTVGFAGGINIGEEWLPVEMAGRGWHDIHVRVRGPAVREFTRLFLSTWQVYGAFLLHSPDILQRAQPVGSELVGILGSRERTKRRVIRRSYLQAIKEASSYIYIANAYFLPDSGFRRALRNAIKRGVDIRVMVPRHGDIWPVQLASEALWGRMLRAGIRIFLWEDAMLHAKTATIDDQWATVGSFNLDHRSFTLNLEVNVNVVGAGLSTRLKELFWVDQARCTELTLAQWSRRSWLQRLVQRFFHLFAKFM